MATDQTFFTELFGNFDSEMRKKVIAHAVNIGVISYDEEQDKFFRKEADASSLTESINRINIEQEGSLLSIIDGFDIEIVQLVADEINQLPDDGGCL